MALKIIVKLILLLLLLFSAAIFMGPYPFKISNQLKVVNQDLIFEPDISSINTKALVDILSKLPSSQFKEVVWEVESSKRYNATIKVGAGNCSNLVFGLAAYLGSIKYPYQIVHLLDSEGFLFGRGHTVILIPYEYAGTTAIGIYDVLEGGFPLNMQEQFAKISDVQNLNFKDRESNFFRLSDRAKIKSNYWNFDDIKRVSPGIIDGQEVSRYFFITDMLYIPIGSRQIERYLYDGLALFFGYLPKVYISESNYSRLMTSSVVRFYVHSSVFLLFLIRVVFAVVFLLITSWFLNCAFSFLKKTGYETDSTKS